MAALPPSNKEYFRTRWSCLEHLRGRLCEHKYAGRRVFLGFDFAYGYPAGFAEVLGLHGDAPPWRVVWNELEFRIDDNKDNSNNRFEVAGGLNLICQGKAPGPFWGCPHGLEFTGLTPTSPSFPYKLDSGLLLAAKRETELRLPGTQPTWKLWNPGNVGSQTLLGIPAVAALRDDPELAEISRVWPFETGFSLDSSHRRPLVLHAEIWPGVVEDGIDKSDPIPDRAQVRAMVEWLAELDATNRLLPLFSLPENLSGETRRNVLDQEGWIFGTGYK